LGAGQIGHHYPTESSTLRQYRKPWRRHFANHHLADRRINSLSAPATARTLNRVHGSTVTTASTDDISFVGSAAWNWWLDVETANSWTSDPTKNTAALEGMVAAFQSAGGTVGIYATTATWTSLMGTTPADSSLYPLGEWRVGASSLTNAKNNCLVKPFTAGGHSVMSQYTSGRFDYDVSCI